MIASAHARLVAVSGALALSLVLVACGGAPAATTPGTATGAPATAAPATPAPASATPAVPGDTTPPNGGSTGNECAAVPTFDVNNPGEMEFSSDPELEAIFPATIGGAAVTDLESFRWVEFLCMFGGQAMVDQMTANIDSPLNFAALSMATANVTVGDEEVQLAAIRFPGQGAENFLTDLAQLVQAFGGSMADIEGSVTTANVGGKTVQVFSSEEGDVAYMYVIGDALMVLSDMTEAQAATVLGALP